MEHHEASRDYDKIEQAIQYLEQNFKRQPSLKEVAAAVFMSEFHFQRLFSRWVGISPKRFLQFLTKDYACQLLNDSHNVLDTSLESGLTGPGRLHDLLVTCEAVTPGQFKTAGAGVTVEYGIYDSPFGRYLLARTSRGICNLFFIMDGDEGAAVHLLENTWKNAEVRRSERTMDPEIGELFYAANTGSESNLHLHLKGTNFQIKVWEALMRIPSGAVVTYQDVAEMIGNPKAVRAVASAVANNPVSFIIPCHRVIRKMGVFHNYRWGSARKKAILGWEAAALEKQRPFYREASV